MDGKTVSINEYVIQRDRDKLMVFYWYQGRGRVIAGEYSGKFWMVADAISRNRTDGALIRVMTPIKDGESEAQSRLVSFTQSLVPYLNQFIPK
jgi:EpsI family protein